MAKSLSEEQRWRAVRDRDVSVDGTFYYAVISTGVFCYPSCASRPARRENVRFFESPERARHAGFRACQRCLPEGPTPSEKRGTLVEQACRLLDTDEPYSIAQVAKTLGVGRQRLAATFRELTGLTPKQWQLARRRENLVEQTLDAPRIVDAVFSAGYESSTRFYADARDRLGMAPSELRAGAVGETIRYTISSSSLGRLLVAWTDKGLCAVELSPEGVNDAEDTWLESRLLERFTHADIIRDDDQGDEFVQAVIARIDEPAEAQALSLDVRGTAFQQRVWSALSRIPVGQTVSYSDVANNMNAPGSHRAVATACAANPLAVVVPCHRVVRADGSLSGYRWGIERKELLLQRESNEQPEHDSAQVSIRDT